MAAVLAFTLVIAAPSRAQTNTYTISGPGAPGANFCVDDNLNVFAGTSATGTLLYSTGTTAMAGCRSAFTFMAKPGESITDQVIDTYGACTSMSPLFISCKNSTPVQVDPGFNLGCGRPSGNQGQSYIYTYTIPALPSCGFTPIASIEFTQATQQYQTLDALKTYVDSEVQTPVQMIATRPAVMRIYFSPVQSVTSYTISASGAVSGTKTVDVPPNCAPQAQRGNQFPCNSTDFYFIAPTGVNDYVITVNDSTGKQLEQETIQMASANQMAIYLKGLAACSIPGVASSCQSPVGLIANTTLVGKLMPTTTVSAFPSAQRVSRNLSLYTDGDQWVDAMVDAVERLYLPAAAALQSSNSMFTDYVGVYSGSISSTGVAGYGGNNIMVPNSAHRLGTQAIVSVIAHEVGHTLKLNHTGIDNPASTNGLSPGCYGAGALVPGITPNWTFPNDNIQSANGLEWGFDLTSETAVNPASTYEIMSYCIPRWASPPNFILAFNRLGTPNGAPAVGGSVAQAAQAQTVHTQATSTAPRPLVQGSFWNVGGVIGSNGVTMDPIFTESMQGFTDPGSGTYSIQLLSATGQTLFARYFTPQVNVTDTTGTDIVSNPQFSEWVPVTAGTAMIAVVDPNGNTLTSLPMTGTAPIVTIMNPVAGFVGSGVQTVTWTIQSAAPTPTSRVYYSADNGTTWLQIEELSGSSDQLDFDTMQGTTTGLLRIDVTDGVSTGSATSIPFSVPKKLPSSIVITSPVTGYTQPAANPLFLTGAAYDADDGALLGSALQWSDNVQGALGSGSPLSVSLNPGPHTITLTATDSDGNAVTATTSITLGGGRPIVSLTTNSLSTNCVSATIGATPGTQGAALSNVQYSVDGGATYNSIPLASLPYSFVVPGSAPVTVVAVALDQSNQQAAQSIAVPLSGTCTSGIPSVSGGSSQTGFVGAAFATPLTTLVSDSNGNPVAGVAVNFTAPTTGAGATFTPATATSGANGVASTVATANSTSGNYKVVATVPGFSTTAQFSLTNTDFSLGLSSSSAMVPHGSTTTATITVTPLSGFNSAITLGCSGLPTGVTCSFSPPSITPSGAPATSTLTITAANNATTTAALLHWGIPGGGFAVALCLLGPGIRRRRKLLGIFALVALAVILASTTGCGTVFKPFTSSITVTATSGTLQHTSSVSLSVQ